MFVVCLSFSSSFLFRFSSFYYHTSIIQPLIMPTMPKFFNYELNYANYTMQQKENYFLPRIGEIDDFIHD